MKLLQDFKKEQQEETILHYVADAVKIVCGWISEAQFLHGQEDWDSVLFLLSDKAGIVIHRTEEYGNAAYILDAKNKTIHVPSSYSLMTITAFMYFLPQVLITDCSYPAAAAFARCVLMLIDDAHMAEHENNLVYLRCQE